MKRGSVVVDVAMIKVAVLKLANQQLTPEPTYIVDDVVTIVLQTCQEESQEHQPWP